MTKTIITFLNILLASILAGTMFGIWIGYDPIRLSSSTYIEQQQSMILQLNVLMPLLGLLTIIITLISAYLQKTDKIASISLVIAASLLIVSGLITRFGNQPINEIVIAWLPGSPPDNWIELRDKWRWLHQLRTVSALLALCIIIYVGVKSSRIGEIKKLTIDRSKKRMINF